MWILLILSVVAIAIVIERLLFFSSQHSDSKGLLRALGQKIAANDLAGAIKVCQQNKGMLPKILEFGLKRGEKNRADITDALSIALMEHLNALERNLWIIGTIAVISPFVGLFGTVLGIIRAFQDIALKGNSTPAVVAASETAARRATRLATTARTTSTATVEASDLSSECVATIQTINVSAARASTNAPSRSHPTLASPLMVS